MVIIRDPNCPPTHWRLGRVIDIHPGSDGIIRVTTIRTEKSETKRCHVCLKTTVSIIFFFVVQNIWTWWIDLSNRQRLWTVSRQGGYVDSTSIKNNNSGNNNITTTKSPCICVQSKTKINVLYIWIISFFFFCVQSCLIKFSFFFIIHLNMVYLKIIFFHDHCLLLLKIWCFWTTQFHLRYIYYKQFRIWNWKNVVSSK